MTFEFFQNCSFTVTFTYFVYTSHSVLQILKCRKPYTWPVVTRFQIYQNHVDRKTIDGFKEHEILVKYAPVYSIELKKPEAASNISPQNHHHPFPSIKVGLPSPHRSSNKHVQRRLGRKVEPGGSELQL